MVLAALALLSAAAIAVFYSNGWLLYYGDAEAHLNIARRMVDSRTPGYDQVGTVWLPLPHWLMLPFVRVDALWLNGLAGAIPSAHRFPAGRHVPLRGGAIASSIAPPPRWPRPALFALNPNVLYLQSIPMTESVFSACLLALLYFTVRFRDTQGWGAVAGAGIAACAATLTRYEGWFLLPFAAVYFADRRAPQPRGRRRCSSACWPASVRYSSLGHHWWLTGDALAFYRGPYSPRAIQGNADYPGKNDWREAFLYYRTAAQLCAGPCLPLIALGGAAGRALPSRLLAAAAAGPARSVLRLEHALLRRHAHLHSAAAAVFLLQQPLRAGRNAAVRAGRRRAGQRGAPVAARRAGDAR